MTVKTKREERFFMKKMKLKDIAFIQSGLVLSRKESENKGKVYKRLTFRSIGEYGFDINSLETFRTSEDISQFLTRENDIILKLFVPLRGVLIDKKSKGFVVPSQLCILRPKDNIDPGFLLGYFNSLGNRIDNLVEDVGLLGQRLVKVNSLREIEVPIVSMEKQILVSSIIREQNKLNGLYRDLIKEENYRLTNIINSVLEMGND